MELSKLMYYAVYTLGRYRTIAAYTPSDIVPTSFDFKVAEEFADYAECEAYCRALNIHLRGNMPDDNDEEC